jgi:hypothetical protein
MVSIGALDDLHSGKKGLNLGMATSRQPQLPFTNSRGFQITAVVLSAVQRGRIPARFCSLLKTGMQITPWDSALCVEKGRRS